ncbi:MAG: hypothetical protein LQ342_001498 [Letrouitia transgressa]|nr:MAG: hypothetical protein LQ342_001498 [Letrouitia transgressa]
MASVAKQTPHQRQPSRSSSASPSSLVTVQRTASSRNGTRQGVPGFRSQSPNSHSYNPANLSVRTLPPDVRRSSAVYSRPESGHGLREGVGNLNRWSQSTVSSKSSSTHNRRNSFSKRLSGSLGSFGGFGGPQTTSPSRGNNKVRYSPKLRAEEQSRGPPPTHPPPVLPPIVTLSSLSQAVDAADSPSTAATATPATADLLSPVIHQKSEHDYFGDRWKARSPAGQGIAVTGKRPSPLPSPDPHANSSSRVTFSAKPEERRPGGPKDTAVSKYSKRVSAQPIERRRQSQNSHSHNRRESGRGSRIGRESSISSGTGSGASSSRKIPSQKAMLSKALQKANHAVTLDNAQNFEGAMDAYGDACALLQKVMLRSSGDEDRRKLEAVRNTYSNRIIELRGTDISYRNADGKALPSRPAGRDSTDQEPLSPLTDEEDDVISIGNATAARLNGSRTSAVQTQVYQEPKQTQIEVPPRRHSLRPPAARIESLNITPLRSQQPTEGDPTATLSATNIRLEPEYMPPPLSPRRPQSPKSTSGKHKASSSDSKDTSMHNPRPQHVRQDTTESTSWLDTIDESGGSSASSVHSRRSSVGLRRKRIRAASGATEAEFDAALDAAVEAAYDDGLEPVNDDFVDDEVEYPDYQREHALQQVYDVRRNVELAKERVREAEREAAIAAAKEYEKRRLQDRKGARDSIDLEYSNDEVDEEERMLEEMTRDYILDSEDNIQTKSALPRQSDSSGFSGRTKGSSIGSNPTSAGTAPTPLSTLAETPALPSILKHLNAESIPPPAHPPPSGALPAPPSSSSSPQRSNAVPTRPPSLGSGSFPGVRERRLSGLKATQLKIETGNNILSAPIAAAPKTQPPVAPDPLSTSTLTEPPKSAFALPDSQQLLASAAFKSPSSTVNTHSSGRKGSSPLPGPSSAETTPSTIPPLPALHKVASADSQESGASMPESPARISNKSSAGPGTLRKNFSSSSLKKILTASVPDSSDTGSSISGSKQRRVPSNPVPSVPTSKGANYFVESLPSGGIHLFESDIHSPLSPGAPNPSAANPPLPLEPCPESPLLRPFWFLRCVYQSIAHPRGGYISTRLFVPRDIWKVANVKLKNVEEKVSSCDLLTATLLKLAKVNTLDADAVLEEMQFLGSVMEQSQINLSKKLGNEVGVAGASWLSKSTSAGDAGTVENPGLKGSNTGTKSYLTSWRKKMSKNNSVGPNWVSTAASSAPKDGNKEAPSMASLPMTAAQNSRFPKRDLSQIQCVGPNAHYMGALARLCDAAQVLDHIARQVEDPGLKHSSPTFNGLEQSARHAAEFFGFYICRFASNDISMMLDKFIKRGSEWVLA